MLAAIAVANGAFVVAQLLRDRRPRPQRVLHLALGHGRRAAHKTIQVELGAVRMVSQVPQLLVVQPKAQIPVPELLLLRHRCGGVRHHGRRREDDVDRGGERSDQPR